MRFHLVNPIFHLLLGILYVAGQIVDEAVVHIGQLSIPTVSASSVKSMVHSCDLSRQLQREIWAISSFMEYGFQCRLDIRCIFEMMMRQSHVHLVP